MMVTANQSHVLAETCSCVVTFKCLLFNFVILTNTTGMSHLKVTLSILPEDSTPMLKHVGV